MSYQTLAHFSALTTRLLRPCTPLPSPYQLAKEAVTAVDGADRRARRNGAQQPLILTRIT